MTQEELITIVDEAQSEGGIDEENGELIRSAIEFDDVDAREILTPRVDLVGVDKETPFEEIAKVFEQNPFSRLPVYEESIDNIIGVVQNETAVNEISQENITTTNNTSESNEVSAAGNKEFETEVQNMTEEERNLYNIAFTVYAGNNISGQMCKALIEGVISSNANHIDVPGRFVAVTQNYTEEVDSTIGVPGNMDNSEEVVQDTNEMLYILRDNTDPDELYNVETVETSGIITEVKITKVE